MEREGEARRIDHLRQALLYLLDGLRTVESLSRLKLPLLNINGKRGGLEGRVAEVRVGDKE